MIRSIRNKDESVRRYNNIRDHAPFLRSLMARDILRGGRLYETIASRLVLKEGHFRVADDRTSTEKARILAGFNHETNREKLDTLEAVMNEMTEQEQVLQEYVRTCISRAWRRGFNKSDGQKSGGAYGAKNRDDLFRCVSRAKSKQMFLEAMSDLARGETVLPIEKQGILWKFMNDNWKQAKSLTVFSFAFYKPKEKTDEDENTLAQNEQIQEPAESIEL
jgi:hypothetical protein